MRPVWVTGAGGFIGFHLSKLLGGEGYRVVGFGRRPMPEFVAAVERGEFVAGGVSGEAMAAALVAHGPPQAIYHLAGGATVGQSIANPLLDFQQSVVSAANVLDFLRCNSPETPVVLASSAAVYGGGYSRPLQVDDHPDPYSPYGHHKLMVEELGRSYWATYGISISVVRLFSVYGEGLRKQLLWDLCQKLAGGHDRIVLGGTGEETRDWHHVSDVIHALRRTLPVRDGQFAVYNGGAGMAASVNSVARLVLTAWGGSCTLSFSGKSRPGDPVNLVSDPLSVSAGWQPTTSLAAGVAAYVDWYRTQAENARR